MKQTYTPDNKYYADLMRNVRDYVKSNPNNSHHVGNYAYHIDDVTMNFAGYGRVEIFGSQRAIGAFMVETLPQITDIELTPSPLEEKAEALA